MPPGGPPIRNTTPTDTGSSGGSISDFLNGLRKSGGSAATPPASSGKKSSDNAVAIAMFKKYGPAWIKTGYYQSVLDYAKVYGVPAPYLAALFLQENAKAIPDLPNGNAIGLAQILDTNVGNYNNQRALVWGNNNSVGVGAPITLAMKKNPAFAIAYAAWRLSGQAAANGGNWQLAYMKGYHGGNNPPNAVASFVPKDYVPGKGSSNPAPVNTKTTNAPSAASSDPYVKVNKKTGKITYTIDSSDKGILEFEGFPITKSVLQRQVQDKNGLGGDFYSLTGKAATANIVASLMASGLNVQQLENKLIHSKFFINSPTGKKYQAGYQNVWQQVMGANKKVPLKWVVDGALNNLDQSEFAAKLRQSPLYLDSNEYNSKKDSFSDSYQSIYGPQDDNAKKLVSDAALAGWDQNQWEHYLRSQKAYTKTQEYKSHALSVLDNLGMLFGFQANLSGADVSKNPGTPDALPSGDSRVSKGSAPATPAPSGVVADLGVNF